MGNGVDDAHKTFVPTRSGNALVITTGRRYNHGHLLLVPRYIFVFTDI
jgi:hypothetical protein